MKTISKIKRRNKVLRLLSPTDCVKDRLAAFFHWNDRQSLEQAILVSRRQSVDLKEIRRWSLKEGAPNKLTIFLKAIQGKSKDKSRRA